MIGTLEDGAAHAILRGTHGDPFAVLGPHDGRLRVFAPDAGTVTAVHDGRETELERVHPEGLFEGEWSGPYRLTDDGRRARMGARRRLRPRPDPVGDGRVPDRRGHPRGALGGAGRAAPGARGRGRRGLRGLGAECEPGVGRGALQRLGRAAPRDAPPRRGIVGDLPARHRARRALQVRAAGRARKPSAAEGRSPELRVRGAAGAGQRRDRPADARLAARARGRARPARRPDERLRGAPGVLAAGRRRPGAVLCRDRADAGGVRRGHGLHPCRAAAGDRAPLHPVLGLPAHRDVRAVGSLRHAGRVRGRWSTRSTAPGSG